MLLMVAFSKYFCNANTLSFIRQKIMFKGLKKNRFLSNTACPRSLV